MWKVSNQVYRLTWGNKNQGRLEAMDWFYTLLFGRRSGGLGRMACSGLGKSALSKVYTVVTSIVLGLVTIV
jgi:hypothetical protein